MIERCANCPFKYSKLVGHKGDVDAEFVVVGESPGKHELMVGKPFVGPSGKVLDQTLEQNKGIKTLFLNAMQCYPGSGTAKDQDRVMAAASACQQRLHQQIKAYPRKSILALGNGAMWGLTGNFSSKITQIRGQHFTSDLAERGIVAAVHPAYLMRGGGSLRQFLADVNYAQSLSLGNDFRKYVIPKIRTLTSPGEVLRLAHIFSDLPPETPIAADTETGGYDGFDHLRDHILSAGFCYTPELVYVIPEHLIPYCSLLFDNRAWFIWHNGKFDAKFLRAPRADVRNVRVDHDTMLLSYALDETKGIHDLEQVSSDYLGMPDWKFMVKKFLDPKMYPKGTRITYDLIPRPILHDYMARDISATLQVFPLMLKQVMADPHLAKLYTQTLLPMSNFLTEVEENGLSVDLQRVNENDIRLAAEIRRLESEINQCVIEAGATPINPNSTQQLATVLYDVLKLPNKGRSTDEEHLGKLPQVPIVKALKAYRKVKKAHSTYVVNLPAFINVDGRVHQTYKIHGTTTGRLACEDPNLLNIPRDPLLRGQFVAEGSEGPIEPKRIFLEPDVNQAELRVLAELSSDVELTRIYTTKGMSIHDETTATLFGNIKSYDEATLRKYIDRFNVHNFPERLYDEMKMKAKNVNFGIPYGITAPGLAEQCKSTVQEAQQWLEKWAEKYKGASLFLRKCRQAPRIGQSLVTPFGRKRRFGVVSQDRIDDIMNQAANFPEQSIASDIVEHVALLLRPHLKDFDAKICNSVYDSLLIEVPNRRDIVEGISTLTLKYLSEVPKMWGLTKIPFVGDIKVGFRWGSLVDLKKYYGNEECYGGEGGFNAPSK